VLDFVIAIVDGTGPSPDFQYEKEMKQSFCSQVYLALAGREPTWAKGGTEFVGKTYACWYERGPSWHGEETTDQADRVVQFLNSRPAKRRFVAGYSRGGSAVIIAALRSPQIPIEAAFLFDPVARHTSDDTWMIPDNVTVAHVARRNVSATLFDRLKHPDSTHHIVDDAGIDIYDDTVPLMSGGHNPFRQWFGTTANEPKAKINEDFFNGTHGALGNVGWKHVPQDALTRCPTEVAGFMNMAFEFENLKVRLTPSEPNSESPLAPVAPPPILRPAQTHALTMRGRTAPGPRQRPGSR
jgi:pimeloyl-ACP methyl ester carboxylesterase